jgi:UDP-N-acetylmuramoyl-tripeptide--D-alanyl-D-alanine ligase
MGHSIRDVPELLRTPVGRRQIRSGIFHALWPVLSRMAGLYRRTLIRNNRVIAVIGSFGKTTATRAVISALRGEPFAGRTPNIGSANAMAMLRIRPSDGPTVLEVGIAFPGEMAKRAWAIRPNITVVTSIGSEHNTSLRSLGVTRKEKAEMVKALPASGVAILNGDDPNVFWMRSQTKARVVSFGFGENNDVRARDVSFDRWPAGMRFTVCMSGQEREVRVRLIGRPMVYSILAAIAVSLAEGRALEAVLPALEAMPPTPGRLEPVLLPCGAVILRDDHKSAKETIEVALDVLSQIPAKRRFVVLGNVTEVQEKQGDLYRYIGGLVGRTASRAIFLASWNNSNYRAGATQAGMPPEAITKAGKDIFKAVELLRAELGQGDVVLVKGRGNEKLERITLALLGHRVTCSLTFCSVRGFDCISCPMLERGS